MIEKDSQKIKQIIRIIVLGRNKMKSTILIFVLSFFVIYHTSAFILRDRLSESEKGDYLVTAQGKNYTLLHIYDKTPQTITIEEITIPNTRVGNGHQWKNWVSQGAPGHTSWILYVIKLSSGAIEKCFSLSTRGWLNMTQQSGSFMPILLNLEFTAVADRERKKAGPPPERDSPDRRSYWQPKMVVEGHEVDGVEFGVWRTHWPKDGSELSGRTVEIYLPKSGSVRYPAYFPYWLQVKGAMGKANVRIIDSGRGLISLGMKNEG
jgi:hypothetical protein